MRYLKSIVESFFLSQNLKNIDRFETREWIFRQAEIRNRRCNYTLALFNKNCSKYISLFEQSLVLSVSWNRINKRTE